MKLILVATTVSLVAKSPLKLPSNAAGGGPIKMRGEFHKNKVQNQKRTAASIRCVWQSGRDAQFSSVRGRM